MTKLLEKALDAVRRMPPDAQDIVAEAMLSLAKIGAMHDEVEDIEPEHLSSVMEGLAQADREEFATDKELSATFHNFKGNWQRGN